MEQGSHMTTYLKAKASGTPTWIDLMTPDVVAARDFYHSVFGWEYDVAGPEFGGYATARLGKLATAGIGGNLPGSPPMPAAWHLYFATEEIAADMARAAELGAKVLMPAMVVGGFGSMALCEDPTGATFGFWQAGQHLGFQVTDEPGAPEWYELYASDANRARDFYAALLGATADPMPGGTYHVLKHGNKWLGGIMQIDPSWGDFHSQWQNYFTVADADETVAIVTRCEGKALGGIVDSPFGRVASLSDPSGALFKVRQHPSR